MPIVFIASVPLFWWGKKCVHKLFDAQWSQYLLPLTFIPVSSAWTKDEPFSFSRTRFSKSSGKPNASLLKLKMALQTNLWVNFNHRLSFLYQLPPFWVRGVDKEKTVSMLQKSCVKKVHSFRSVSKFIDLAKILKRRNECTLRLCSITQQNSRVLFFRIPGYVGIPTEF